MPPASSRGRVCSGVRVAYHSGAGLGRECPGRRDTMSSAVTSPELGPVPAHAPPARRGGFVGPAGTIWHREVIRFVRQRNRVIGALGTPIVFWLLIGSGLDRSFRVPGQAEGELGYLAYFFPGAVALIVLFTAIFSTISVIEDRREGFLQGVLVAPVSRLAIVTGKVLGGATLATLQAVGFMLIWPAVGPMPTAAGAALAVIGVVLMAVQLTALGLALAWPMDSTAGFHALMNLLLMPMWLLCGAVFPVDTAPAWLRGVMLVNPLTYGHAALSAALLGEPVGGPGLGLSLVVLGATAAALMGVSAWIASRPGRGGS